MRSRAERRRSASAAKAKARLLISKVWKLPLTPQRVGHTATMHGTCPCGMCVHRNLGEDPRRRFEPKLHELP